MGSAKGLLSPKMSVLMVHYVLFSNAYFGAAPFSWVPIHFLSKMGAGRISARIIAGILAKTVFSPIFRSGDHQRAWVGLDKKTPVTPRLDYQEDAIEHYRKQGEESCLRGR